MALEIQKDKTIKVVTYNIFLFSDPKIIARNISVMAKQGVSVFCLQEVLKSKERQFVGDTIIKLLGEGWGIEYNLGTDNTRVSHGVAILWNKHKFRKISVKKTVLPKLIKLSFTTKLLRYLLQFKDISIEHQAISIRFSVNNKIIRVTSMHLAVAGGSNHRLTQHKFLKETLEHKPELYEVICGDFNTIRGKTYKDELLSIQNLYGKNFIEPTSDIPWTQDLHESIFDRVILNMLIKYSKLHYRQKLDHIYTKGFTPRSSERLKLQGSDHFPLASSLVFN